MALALDPEADISELIVVDIAPAKATLSESFIKYVEAMKKIEGMTLSSRKEALSVLREYEPVSVLLKPMCNLS